MAKGWDVRLGSMALLRHGDVRVAVSGRKMQALDQAPFRHPGLESLGQASCAQEVGAFPR
jgi:microcystin degradation protein MlrC